MASAAKAFFAVVLLASFAPRPAHGGELRGTLRVSSAPRQPSANPYPGQVRAATGEHHSAAAVATPLDAVVSLAPAEGAAPRAPAKKTPPARRAELRQQGQAFVPRVLPVLVGTAVDFPNDDPFYHNVFSYSSAKRFDLGRYGKGKSRSVVFERPGLVKVFCDIHSDMAAYIVVLDSPLFAVPTTAGEFVIANVPPGEYVATAWHPDCAPWSASVSIPADGPASLEIDLQ